MASLASLYAFRMMGLFMVLPVLTLYGQEYTGSTTFLLGVALGAYGFTQALLQVPFGMLSDRWGRKPVIVVGLVLFALGSVVAALTDSVYGLILGRCLQGGGAIAGAIMALVADLTAEENRTKAMASIGASIGISFSVALVLGPWVAGLGGLSGVFWLTAGFAGIGLVVLFTLIPTPRRVSKHPAGSRREASAVPSLLEQTLRHPELLRLYSGIFSLHFILMANFVALPVVLTNQLGLAGESHWKVYLPLLALAFATMVPFIIIAERRRRMKTVFLSAVALLGAMEAAMVWLQVNMLGALMGLFLFFLAFNLLEATLPSLMSKIAPAGSKGTASGIYSTCQFLGAFGGGVAGGGMMQLGGAAWVFACCAVVGGIWLSIASFMCSPRHLSSVWVPLSEQKLSQLASTQQLLSGLAGVEEVIILAEERAACLKVDSSRFDRQVISEFA